FVSARCRFVDEEGMRFVLLDGVVAFQYHLSDRTEERVAWSSVYLNKYATQWQIARAIGKVPRTVRYWVTRRREKGVEGLADRPRSGAPRRVGEATRQRILRLRAQKTKLREIARLCHVGYGTVRTIVSASAAAREQASASLALPSAADGTPSPASLAAEPSAATVVAVATAATAAEMTAAETAVAETPAEESTAALELTTAAVTITAAVQPAPVLSDRTEASLAVDRTTDRTAARLGALRDAAPLFAPVERTPWAGVLMALALLSKDPLLATVQSFCGSFRAAFYGLRTVLVTLVAMALLRIRRVEQLRDDQPRTLGLVLGLDRAPDVKTLRGKLGALLARGQMAQVTTAVAQARACTSGPIRAVYTDGHVTVYHGQAKVGETWSARCRKVVKGQTTNWVHLPGGMPLLAIPSEFNESLSHVLPEVVAEVCRVLPPGSKPLVAFDRGGHCALTFERLLALGCGLLTYRRDPGAPLPDNLFQPCPTQIGPRLYAHAPYEREVRLPVYETIDRGPGRKPGRRATGRTVVLREIRIRRQDGGQTVILAGGTDLPATDLAAILFGRIGDQENIFKYLRQEFALDCQITYDKTPVAAGADHPNPRYVEAEKLRRELRRQRNAILARLGKSCATLPPEQAIAQARATLSPGQIGRLTDLDARLAQLSDELATLPPREHPAQAGYCQPSVQGRMLSALLATTAWTLENQLVDLIAPHYARSQQEARTLIAAVMRTAGSLSLQPGKLVVRLEPQSCPARTRAVNALGEQLTAMALTFPGSARRLVFEPTPVPPPPARLKRQ
ncbi:MAG: hypothetical protein QG597_19, partial [Actinomycetota bacterium]|nr:hypothetical protein [Actinomycetota bacterium]